MLSGRSGQRVGETRGQQRSAVVVVRSGVLGSGVGVECHNTATQDNFSIFFSSKQYFLDRWILTFTSFKSTRTGNFFNGKK